jgi:hypothetical protein
MPGELKDVSKLTDSEKAIEVRLEAERRSNNCKIDIQGVLKKWDCQLDPQISISRSGVRVNYEIIAIVRVPAP